MGRLGTEVVLLEALDQILPLEDEDIARAAAREIKKQNVRIETGASVESASPSDSGVSVTFNGETAEFDYLVIAAGRAPDVEGLGLDEAGIERDERGLIKVDGRLRTSREGVWAIGDMVPGPRSPTRHPTRGSSPSRTRPGTKSTRSTTRTSRP